MTACATVTSPSTLGVAKEQCVTQRYYACQGIITEEMEYVAIRENQLIDEA